MELIPQSLADPQQSDTDAGRCDAFSGRNFLSRIPLQALLQQLPVALRATIQQPAYLYRIQIESVASVPIFNLSAAPLSLRSPAQNKRGVL